MLPLSFSVHFLPQWADKILTLRKEMFTAQNLPFVKQLKGLVGRKHLIIKECWVLIMWTISRKCIPLREPSFGKTCPDWDVGRLWELMDGFKWNSCWYIVDIWTGKQTNPSLQSEAIYKETKHLGGFWIQTIMHDTNLWSYRRLAALMRAQCWCSW